MKHERLFSFVNVVIALTILAAVAEGGMIAARYGAFRKARMRSGRIERELRAMTDLAPGATSENAARIEDDLAQLRQDLTDMKARLALNETASGRSPVQRPEAFFRIAAFVERMRDRASEAGVKLKSGERFGFSAYAQEAPERARVDEILRQCLIVEAVLGVLFEAQPAELLSVQRESAGPSRSGDATPRAARTAVRRVVGRDSSDEFELEPEWSLRVPGAIETSAFRLVFAGDSTVLRSLLNGLVDLELPLVIRMVEVAPMNEASGTVAKTPETGLLVTRTLRRLSVTFEAIDQLKRRGGTER